MNKAVKALAVALLMLSMSAEAMGAEAIKTEKDTAEKDTTWHLAAEAQTDLFTLAGGSLVLETPGRILLTQTVGWLPRGYAVTALDIAVGLELMEQRVADLLVEVLENSVVWRSQVGWQPFAKRGFYVLGGWTLLTLGGASTPGELLQSLTGVELSEEAAEGLGQPFDISSQIAMLDAELGWRWVLWEQFTLRAGLGGAFTVASSTRIEPGFTPRAPRAVRAFSSLAENATNRQIENNLNLPSLRLAVGYRF
jgi:hypothetical protein